MKDIDLEHGIVMVREGKGGKERPVMLPKALHGEPLASQLAAGITMADSNSNAVTTRDSPFGDSDLEALRLKLNDLILALRR